MLIIVNQRQNIHLKTLVNLIHRQIPGGINQTAGSRIMSAFQMAGHFFVVVLNRKSVGRKNPVAYGFNRIRSTDTALIYERYHSTQAYALHSAASFL